MQAIPTRILGPLLLEPVVHSDQRGFFQETYRRNTFSDLGIGLDFVQENHSRSQQRVVRGMHFQPGMAKLVRCARGAIFDVIVDIRPGSGTFGEWEGFTLSDENHHQLLVPDGFAHGFCVLSELADVVYRCSDYYNPGTESGFNFEDPDVGIRWPHADELAASTRDAGAPRLRELNLEAVLS